MTVNSRMAQCKSGVVVFGAFGTTRPPTARWLGSIDFQKSKPSIGRNWVRQKIQYSSNRCSDSDSGKECDPKPVHVILPRHLNVLSCKGTAGFVVQTLRLSEFKGGPWALHVKNVPSSRWNRRNSAMSIWWKVIKSIYNLNSAVVLQSNFHSYLHLIHLHFTLKRLNKKKIHKDCKDLEYAKNEHNKHHQEYFNIPKRVKRKRNEVFVYESIF
jgi:hypothetical protein